MRLLAAALALAFLSAVLVSCRCDDEPAAAASPEAGADAPRADAPADAPGTQVECPVCGLRFGESEAVATHEHRGRTYNFLLEDHKLAFTADPARYLERESPENTKLSPDAANK